MISCNRDARRVAISLALSACLLGLAAAPAVAAPSFEVELSSDANEVQVVKVDASAGQFRLNFGTGGPGVSETSDLVFNASAGAVRAALDGLSNVSAGGGSVSVSGGPGSVGGTNPYIVTFTGGVLASTNVPQISAVSGAVPLSGGASTVTAGTLHQGGISHSDERMEYTATVTNTALADTSPEVGESLTCNPGSWNGSPTFTYQWIRNGVPITGATASTYIVSATSTTTPPTTVGDAGAVVQCRVTGTNAAAVGVATSIPAAVVDPQPSPTPPTGSARPKITPSLAVTFNEATGKFQSGGVDSPTLTCTAPSGWTGTGLAWSFHWLRNGVDLGSANVVESTATTSKYELQLADRFKGMQCEAVAEGANGKSVVLPFVKPIEVVGPPDATALPKTEFQALSANDTAGTVTLELELPGEEETYAYKAEGNGWSCDEVPAIGGQPAKAVCTRSDVLRAGEAWDSNDVLKVIAALGADSGEVGVARAIAYGGGVPAPASDTDEFTFASPIPFGLTEFTSGLLDSAGQPYSKAGGHPFSGVANLAFAKKRKLVPDSTEERGKYALVGHVKRLVTDLPRGQVGNALATPELCGSADDVSAHKCPDGSVVGGIDLFFPNGGQLRNPIFAIEHEFGTPAQFAFTEPSQNTFTFSARLRPDDGYAVSLEVTDAPEIEVLESLVTFCDFGAKVGGVTGQEFLGCKEAGEPGANPKALFTNPTNCSGPPPVVRISIDSWEDPGQFVESSSTSPPITGCDEVEFEPEVKKLAPESQQADSATGLDLELTMPTEGLEQPLGTSQSNMKRSTITFPRGLTVNPTAGQGLGACSAEQVKLGTNQPVECPDSSKLGSVEIETPILEDTLKGAVYNAKQGDVDGSLIGFYIVFDSKENGILIKMPAKVEPQPDGQLVATVDDIPEAPFSVARFHFPGGPRAALMTPPKCGTYAFKSELVPWSAADPDNPTPAETVTRESAFEVSSGPGGGPCPSGALEPKLSAGVESAVAGKTSPFVMRLSRDDGSQRFSGLNIHLPPGLSAYLKGIPYCPDSVLASISSDAGTGQGQIDHPSCPIASQIGAAVVGAGTGANPLYVDTGRAYLAGPYKGAPLSIAVVAPAVAGPIDLGTVVVRNAAYIDPETAEVSVISDPVPTILHGLMLDIRDIRVMVDRPSFILNPTNCEPMSVGVDVTGEDGGKESPSNDFQVDGCAGLSFKPNFSLRLFGGPGRGVNPKLRTIYTAPEGGANLNDAAVTIPRSEFLDQSHIRTVCTRVQFAADACPPGSIYGHITALSPIVDYPVSGPIYLRSSNHKLPDLVFDLHGPDYQPVEIVASARVDSIKGQIRVTVENAPDVPVSKIIVTQQGGKKGLLINSRNICAHKNRATVKLTGQNGKTHNTRPVVKNGNCKSQRKAKRKHRRQEKRAAAQRRGVR